MPFLKVILTDDLQNCFFPYNSQSFDTFIDAARYYRNAKQSLIGNGLIRLIECCDNVSKIRYTYRQSN